MYTVNRNLAIIRPKEPFFQWLKTVPDPNGSPTPEEVQQDCTVFLIPDFDTESAARAYIERRHAELFAFELNEWYRDEAVWPKKRDLKTFRDWFDLEIHSVVIDLLDGAIEKEDW
jgi:hypothetical protein